MVAVRSAHLNTAGEFALDEWIAGLGLPNPQSCERLAATWRYCEQQTQNHPDASLLLWRGLEMVEILSTLSMDNDSMRAALLFPLVDAGIVQEETLTEAFGKGIVALVHGVRDMDAIRQLKATQNDSMASEQVDNVRRMLLAMVEDFRCVVIKLAERIAHLREVKDAPEDERVLAAKECSNIYAPLANRLGIGQLKWELEDFCFRYLHPEEYKRIAKLLHERRIDREQFIDDFVAGLRTEMASEGIRVRSTAGRNTSTASGARCRKAPGVRRTVRRARGAHRGGAPAGLLCGVGHRAYPLPPSAGRVRRLRRQPETQRLPVDPHRGAGAARQNRRDSDPHPANA